MLIIHYKNRLFHFTEGVGRGEILNPVNKRTDVLMKLELSLSAPKSLIIKKGNYFELNIPNFLIDLKQDKDLIYKKIHKSTRADIRKAEEIDKFTYIEMDHPTDKQIKEFTILFNSFAKEKKLAPCNLRKLIEIRNKHSLLATSVVDEDGNILCASMLIIDQECKQLYGIYGVSARFSKSTQKERSIVGRANKLLQWKEIQSAKRRGMDWYNFGGEVHQEEDQGVNDFKRRFGTIRGFDRRTYTSKSLLGMVCVNMLYRKWRKSLHAKQSNDVIKSTTVV